MVKIGLCTGGGDCPGLNAVIRAVVKHAIGTYGWEVHGIKDSFNGLMARPLQVRKLTLDDVSDILPKGGTILGTTNAGNPFAGGSEESKKKIQLIVDAYKQLGLEAIIVVGGDGTQTIAHQLLQYGINIVGVPKTIDNDLAATDETIGFNTAVEVAAEAVSRLQSTAESHDRIMLLEVMGRDAGHIALHAGMAGGANIILLPEIPFDYQYITAKIEQRRRQGRYYSLVVVAEGAHEAGANANYVVSTTSAHQPKNLGGIGGLVAQELFARTKIETRVTVLGHIQRGGTPTPYDRVLATVFGTRAVDLVKQKKFGMFVAKAGSGFTEVSYDKAAGKYRPLELDNPYLLAAEASGISLGRDTTGAG